MKAFVFHQTGEPADVLALEDLPTPEPAANEVLVRMRLAPINPSDLHVLRGRFGRQPPLPASPGLEGMGTVEAIGRDVHGLSPGTRVVLLDVPGTWRALIVAPADRVVPIPHGVSDEDAAQALVNPVTALAMILGVHRLQRGDTLVQTAAGSTVGRLVIQLARTIGFRTMNLVRRADQLDGILVAGGDVAICTAADGWEAQLLAATNGSGAMHAIDCVAGAVGAGVVRCLAPGGRMLVYGALSSHRQTDVTAFQMPLFAPQLIYKAATVQGWYLFHWLAVTPLDETRRMLEHALELLASGGLRLPHVTRYPLSEIDSALRAVEASRRDGKPLLDFADA